MNNQKMNQFLTSQISKQITNKVALMATQQRVMAFPMLNGCHRITITKVIPKIQSTPEEVEAAPIN